MVSETKIDLLRRLNNITKNAPLLKVTVKQLKGIASIQNSIAKGTLKTKEQLNIKLTNLGYLPFFTPKR